MKRSSSFARAMAKTRTTAYLFGKLSIRDARALLRILKKIRLAGLRHLASASKEDLEAAFFSKLNWKLIARGLADAKAGRVVPLDTALEKIRPSDKALPKVKTRK